MRKKVQRADGYCVSVSRTFQAPVAAAYKAWATPAARKKWLAPDELTVRTASDEKSIRATWGDAGTAVDVNFYAKGDGKCQVSVEHRKLKTEAHAGRVKRAWAEAMERLRAQLER